MSHRRFVAWKLLLLCALFIPLTSFSQTGSLLEKFELDATQPREDSQTQPRENSQNQHSHRAHDTHETVRDDSASYSDQLEQELISSVAELVFDMFSYPGIYSWQRVAPPMADNSSEEYAATPRNPGEGVIPFARVDVSYHYVNSRVHALSGRGEVGYGPFGFEARTARYSESEPDATLDIVQYHFLYRMSLEDHVELDIGYGEYELSGVADNIGPSGTLHLLIYPSEQIGIELRPSWASINGNSISDHEMAMSYGGRYWAARAGYHWLTSPSTSLSGPFVGLSLRF